MTKQGTKARAETNGGEPVVDDLKAALLAPDDLEADTVDIEIEGIGTVTVRGLTRDESHLIAKKKTALDAEIQMIVLGMVNPKLTFDEAKLLTRKRAGIMQTITDMISKKSGTWEGARKEAMATFLDESE